VTSADPGNEAADPAGKPERGRSFVVLAAISAVVFAILAGLGVWQLERRAWKEALIARVEAGLAADAVAAPGPDAWPSLSIGEAEYATVEATGVFDHAKEIHVVHTLVEPKGPAGGIGYQVFTPFRTDAGWWVYVNRGFVPRENKEPATRSAGQIAGETTVTGLLRSPSRRSWFMPADDVAGNAWFSRDPSLFAAASGLPPEAVAPYVIDARFDPDLPGGLPQGGETIVSFPNNHLQYAVTWLGLAMVLVAVFAAFAVKRIRG
jgi:surfeit locus 1 family protein